MLRRIRELFNDVFRQADLVLLALCIGTSLFGILMIASATRYMHTSKLVLVQAAALCIGAVLYIVVSQVDLNELAKYWKWIFLVGVVFILLLATPLGIAGDTGNKAWLEFPFLPVKAAAKKGMFASPRAAAARAPAMDAPAVLATVFSVRTAVMGCSMLERIWNNISPARDPRSRSCSMWVHCTE